MDPLKLKKLEKLAKVLDNGDVELLTQIDQLEERLDREIEGVKAVVTQAVSIAEQTQKMAGERGEKGERGNDGVDGKNGLDGAVGPQGVPGKDGRDGVDGKSIVGPQGEPGRDGKDGFVDEATVAYLEDEVKKAKLDKEAYDRALGIVDQRTSFSINKASNLERDKITGIGVHTITLGSTAPTNPTTTDLWIDTDAAPSGGGGAWGDITGTLSDQTDLQSALDGKADVGSGLTAPQVASFISIRF